MLKEISKYEQSQKETIDGVDDKFKTKENMKEVYVSDICQKTMFDEVYKNQMKIIEDKEKEMALKKKEDQKLKDLEKEEKKVGEERKKAEANSKNE